MRKLGKSGNAINNKGFSNLASNFFNENQCLFIIANELSKVTPEITAANGKAIT